MSDNTPPGFTRPSWSWKRATGLTAARQRFAQKTGIPTTRAGMERKVGRIILRAVKWLIALALVAGAVLLAWGWLVA